MPATKEVKRVEKTIRKIESKRPVLPVRERVAAYARVSSGNEATLHSLSAQVSYFSNLIQRNPEWHYVGVYVDEAITGTTEKREGFQRMLADCRAGKIDRIITKCMSRFARNTVTLLKTVRELKELGIDVYFEKQNIHSMSGDGELMLSILASFAQEESRSVSENCKWRIRSDFQQGKPTTTRMNGLKIDHGTVTVIPEEARVVSLIFALRQAGMGKNGIARELNRRGIPAKNGGIWYESVIQTILKNEKYQGDLLLQKQYRIDHLSKIDRKNRGELPQYLVTDNHEAIIRRDTFAEVQASIAERAARFPDKHGQRKQYPFTEKLVCEHCGKHYKRRKNSGKVAWQCYTYMTRGKEYCPAKQIRESVLEAACAEVIRTPEFDAEAFDAQVEWIDVCEGNRLVFHFRDAHTETYIWKDPSRRNSWTDEMRAQAAEHARKRYTK